MKKILKEKRVALLDIHSPLYLSSDYNQLGGGDIDDIYRIIDIASRAGFSIVQFTPIQDTGENSSPYMGISIFSINPVFLSVSRITQTKKIKNLIAKRKAETIHEPQHSIRYRNIYQFKKKILKEIYENEGKDFSLSSISDNVLAYAVFVALKHKFKRRWPNWPNYFKFASPKEILQRYPSLEEEVKSIAFGQKILLDQWKDLAKYASKKNIAIMLDKPIYPTHDSADVWANKEIFYLKSDGELKYLSGCDNPGDPFGMQIWGHVVYKYKENSEKVIEYHKKSIKFMRQISSLIRLDHTLAIVWKYYIIDPVTKKGKHIKALGRKFFLEITKAFPDLFIVAEDTGYINSRLVDRPLGEFEIPGIRCPQWSNRSKYWQIYKYPKNCLGATSLHDLDSIYKWWRNLHKNDRIKYIRQSRKYKKQNKIPYSKTSPLDVIELVFASKSNIASVTLRDIVGDTRRYNTPGKKNLKNWRSRCPVAIERINFAPISEIIKRTSR